MTSATMPSAAEYLVAIRRKIDALKAVARRPSYLSSEKQQDKVLLHFINRTVEIGEACFLVSELQTPLFVLSRVMCEHFFLTFWVSLSEKNAAEYARKPVSELAKVLRININRGQAKILNKTTGEDATKELAPEIEKLVEAATRIENIARENGLGKVYDFVYRPGSMYVHGNTLDVFSNPDSGWQVGALSAVAALLNCVFLIVENPERTTTAAEILNALHI
jgi:hypothetical protein